MGYNFFRIFTNLLSTRGWITMWVVGVCVFVSIWCFRKVYMYLSHLITQIHDVSDLKLNMNSLTERVEHLQQNVSWAEQIGEEECKKLIEALHTNDYFHSKTQLEMTRINNHIDCWKGHIPIMKNIENDSHNFMLMIFVELDRVTRLFYHNIHIFNEEPTLYLESKHREEFTQLVKDLLFLEHLIRDHPVFYESWKHMYELLLNLKDALKDTVHFSINISDLRCQSRENYRKYSQSWKVIYGEHIFKDKSKESKNTNEEREWR